MKKTLIALFGAAFLALAPTAAQADCFPIETAKSIVAEYDTKAVWEYLKPGSPAFDRLAVWMKTQNLVLRDEEGKEALIDGFVVAKAVDPTSGNVVMVAASANGTCVDQGTFVKFTEEQYNSIIEGGV